MTAQEDQVTSFRLKVSVTPSWVAILDWVAERAGLSRDKIVVVDKGAPYSLGGYKGFVFVWFQDRVSGLRMIWSDHHRTFVEDMVAGGLVFAPDAGKRLDYQYLVIDPQRIGFRPPYFGYEESTDLIDELATMPFDGILRLLLRLEQAEIGLGMRAIREFPPDLAQDLVKTGTVYDAGYSLRPYFEDEPLELTPWERTELPDWADTLGVGLFADEVEYHHFKNGFYSLDLRLECFSPMSHKIEWFFQQLRL